MKRLISWLLALTMIMSLPLSALAVEIGDGDPDVDVGFEELLPGYNVNDPIDLTADLRPDFTATVKVPAGKTMYFIANNIGGMLMTINDGEAVECTAAPRQPYAWSITNDGEAEAEYTIKVAFPVGHEMNPKVIEEMAMYSDEVAQAAGDNNGFFYTYTAKEAGTVTLYFNAVYDENGDLVENVGIRDIKVTNNNTYAQYSLQQDGVDNYGLELQVPVAAGDQLIINTAWVTDAAGNYYPEATYSWTGNFAYPAGSEKNPIAIEWAWNDTYSTATASVEVPEGGAYYTGNAGMILTAGDNAIEMDAEGKFFLAAGNYELVMSTPVGAQANPEVIENIDGYTSTQSLEADGSYYYIWTATEDGTVTLDITDGANIVVDHITGVSEDGWPISVQSQLAEPEIDENWNYTGWTVAENLVIEVKAGEQLKIQVNGLTDWATWTTPAIDYTLTGSFEAASKPVINFAAMTVSFDAEIKLGLRFILPAEFLADADAKAVVTKYTNYDKGMQTTVTEYSVAELIALGTDSNGRTTIFQGTASGEMTAEVTYEFFNGKGEKLMITDYSNNNVEVDVISRSVLDYAEAALTKGTAKQKAINTALVVYGGYAQLYFKVDSANPAFNLLTELGMEIPDISSIGADSISQVVTNSGGKGSGFGIYQDKQTAGLDSAIYLKPYFYEDGASINDFEFVVTYLDAKGNSYTEVATPESLNNGARYGITVHDIPGAYLDHSYTITATNKTTGQVYTVNSSVMSWVKSLLAASTNAAQLNLGRAMKFYSDAANTYFGK